jgi:uncharacterized repeat protein (TIGR01451 family)
VSSNKVGSIVMRSLRACLKTGGAVGAFMDQAGRRGAATLVVLASVIAVLAAGAVCAAASPPGPSWSIESSSPTYFVPGKSSIYNVVVSNVGTGPAEEVTITDTLPAGVEFKSVSFYWSGFPGTDINAFFPVCPAPIGQQVRCTFPPSGFSLQIEPGQTMRMLIDVAVSPSAPEGPIINKALVEGGGAQASTSSQSTISAHPPFGITQFSVEPTERTEEMVTGETSEFVNVPYRTPFTQAGGHPWGLTFKGEFASEIVETRDKAEANPVPTRDPKDIVVNLPPGLLGDPMATPRCSLTLVTSTDQQCPNDTQIGIYRIRMEGGHEFVAPVVNVTPEAGQSGEFALENTVKIDTPLLTAHLVHTIQGVSGCTTVGGCYGFTVVSNNVPALAILGFEVTIWGIPTDPSHDPMRGRFCRRPSAVDPLKCEGGFVAAGIAPVPFLTMPTNCSAGPETTVLRADSWQEPGSVSEGRYSGYEEARSVLPGATGCDLLRFDPTIEVHPNTPIADEPVELGVGLQVPLSETPESNATPQLRDTTLTLPEGMSISPGIVDGIQACDEFGPHGINITGPESEEVGLSGELQLASGHCPDASTVGTAEAITPFLPIPVKGHVYLARPSCGGLGQPACSEEDARDGTLYRLYLELGGTGELAQTGVHFKVPLEAHVNTATGQITTTTLGTPQAPFSELRIHLNGGPRAPIDNPSTCGPAVTTADFTPWSAPGITPEGLPMPGTPDATPSSFFDVQGCASPSGLHPAFTAGTVLSQAGSYTPFTMNLSREDRQQFVKGLQIHTPPGLLGMLSSVPLCGEPQADAGTCSETAKIGTTRVASGAGSHPFEIEGSVYLTGPYDGAPFGLSVVTHVVAGPFNLGVVVVRAKINVDQTTSVLTVTTDESGPHALPQIFFGVPLRLKRITVNIDRPGFMFNPTNCAAQKITAFVSGSEGAIAEVSSPFAVGGCRALAFTPKFKVSTSGKTSRVNGASLDTKLSYPKGAFGKEANIARVKVSLPRHLPSRLSTLQKACTTAVFAANPANCPKASIVGIVRVSTPLLPVELSGPAYFVSHGGEAFPSLVIVLQGDGVSVDVTGTTFISSKTNVTSTTFKTVPDVPFNSFELYLPQGRYSALAATGNLCKLAGKLKMPTEFVAQNGAVIKQSTKIAVTGCPAKKGAGTARRRNAGTNGRAGK